MQSVYRANARCLFSRGPPNRATRSRTRGRHGCGEAAAAVALPNLASEKRWSADEAQVEVIQDRDSTCHAIMAARVEADPHRIYQVFERSDYDKIFEIFKATHLHEVVEDDGLGQKLVDLHVDAQWSFWKVSGVCFIPIAMQMDKTKGEIAFFQKYPGFLKEYRGAWRIMQLDEAGRAIDPLTTPWSAIGYNSLLEGETSLVSLQLTVKPSVTPPPPINKLLKGNTVGQMESLFRDLKAEVSKAPEPDSFD